MCNIFSAAVDLKNPPGAVYSGEPKGEKAGCTLTLSDDDFIGLVNGELKAQQVHYFVCLVYSLILPKGFFSLFHIHGSG